MHKFVAALTKRTFVKNMAVMMTGTSIGQIVTLLTTPILSRLYAPSMFGAFGVFSSIVIMISMVATLRYDHALVLPKKDSDAINLLAVSVLCVCIFSLLSLIGCLIFKDLIHASIVGAHDADFWSILIPAAVLLTGLYQSLSAWSVRKKLFVVTATSHVSRSIISSLVKIIAGFKHPHALGLIYGQLGGDLAASANVIYRIFPDRNLLRSSVSLGRMKALAKENLDFAAYGSGQLLVGAAALQVPVLLMAKYYGSTNVGFYTFAVSMIQFPLAMVQNSLRQVFFQKACETFNSQGDVYNLLRKTTLGLYALFLAPALIIFFFGPAIFGFIFGSGWVTAGVFAQCIIPASFIAFPKVPALVLTRIYRKQKQLLLLECFFLGAEIIVYTQLAQKITVINMLILHAVIISIYNLCLIGWMLNVTKKIRYFRDGGPPLMPES